MKCPKCGSEHIQFATKSSGGGFSFSNSCCGYILLGPLGLLCGACGSGTHTEEFWVCQECGNKFSNWEATQRQTQENRNKAQKEQETALYLRYVEELNALRPVEGDNETIRSRAKEAAERKDTTEKAKEDFLKLLAGSDDEYARTLAKRQQLNVISTIALASLGLGLLLCFLLFPLGCAMLIAGLVLIVVWGYLASDSEKKLSAYSDEFKNLAEEADSAKAEDERLKALVKKVNFIENYRP